MYSVTELMTDSKALTCLVWHFAYYATTASDCVLVYWPRFTRHKSPVSSGIDYLQAIEYLEQCSCAIRPGIVDTKMKADDKSLVCSCYVDGDGFCLYSSRLTSVLWIVIAMASVFFHVGSHHIWYRIEFPSGSWINWIHVMDTSINNWNKTSMENEAMFDWRGDDRISASCRLVSVNACSHDCVICMTLRWNDQRYLPLLIRFPKALVQQRPQLYIAMTLTFCQRGGLRFRP